MPTVHINLCLPSGEATCARLYPGGSVGGAMEYRWTYVGIMIDGAWGMLTVGGSGADQIEHRVTHAGLTLRGYWPINRLVDLSFGMGLGYGSTSLKDAESNSEVSWSSFWSDLQVSLGAVIAISPNLSIDAGLVLTEHLKGSRCIIYNKAGPCEEVATLPPNEQDISSLLQARTGLKYTF